MSQRPTSSLILWANSAFRLLFLYAAIGVVAGTGWAFVRLVLEGSLQAGFRHTLFLTLREETTRLGMAGVILGALIVLAGFLLSHGAPALRRSFCLASFIGFLRRKNLGPWPYLLIMALCLAVAGLSLFFSARGKSLLSGCIVAAFVLCGFYAFFRAVACRSSDPEGPGLRGFFAACFGGLLFLALSGTALWNAVYNPAGKFRHIFAHRELLIATAIVIPCALVVFLLLRFHAVYAVSLERSGKSGSPIRIFRTILVLAAATLWLYPPGLFRPKFEAANPKNVILIGIDTLRNDHTSILAPSGKGKRDLTPNLRRLAAHGTVFETAISQAPWTLPAFSSILTGRYPHDHGAVSVFSELGGGQTTLAEILREAGYATGAVVSHLFVDSKHGFSQGFGFFDEENSLGHWAITSENVTDRALEFLEEKGDENFFLFLHYFDPHNAYRDHEAWDYADSYSGWLSEGTQDITSLRNERQALDAADTQYLTDLYDEEIAFTDQQIGRLLNELRSRGFDKDTAILVVADHGEEFMERGWLGHSATLHDELIHVPLFFVLPGGEKQVARVTTAVETRSVFSTILDFVGIDFVGIDPGAAKEPPSLIPLTRPGGAVELPRPVFSAVGFPDYYFSPREQRPKIVAMRLGRWKVIRDLGRGRRYLFDIESDPLEKRNLCDEEHEQMAELLKRLDVWITDVEDISKRPAETSPAAPSGNMEALRALGYVK
jgi:arylsulfatase A-like enzyme